VAIELVAASRSQQLEPLRQAGEDLAGCQRAGAGGGELDGERDAVERTGEGAERPGVPGLDVGRAGRSRPIRQQAHRFTGEDVGGRSVGGGQVQRPELDDVLAGESEALAGGDEQAESRGVGQPQRELAGAGHQLFEVVQDQQKGPPVGQGLGERLAVRGDGSGVARANAERRPHRRADLGRISRGREIAEAGTRALVPSTRLREAQGETCLADARRADERDQTSAVLEATRDGLEQAGPTHEAGRRRSGHAGGGAAD
jgi:hypothetical protein